MSPAAYHHGNLRSALLAQAEVALRQVGVDGLSLRQIARDLGVSHGAPARHFRDKQALLDALTLDGFETLNTQLAGAAATGDTLRERFEAMARAYITFATEHAELLQVMYSTKHHADASEHLRATGEKGMTTARSLLAEAQADGQLRDGDPDVLAVVVLAQVHGLAGLAAGGMLNGVPAATLISTALDVLWTGLSGPISGG